MYIFTACSSLLGLPRPPSCFKKKCYQSYITPWKPQMPSLQSWAHCSSVSFDDKRKARFMGPWKEYEQRRQFWNCLSIFSFNSLLPNAQAVPRTLDSSFVFPVGLKIDFKIFILKIVWRQPSSWWPYDSCFYLCKVARFQQKGWGMIPLLLSPVFMEGESAPSSLHHQAKKALEP